MTKVNKMGYIFPKRIRDAIAGEETPFGSKFYQGGLTNDEKKVFDEQRVLDREERQKKEDAISGATNPWYCPVCNKLMRKRLDKKYYNVRNMCMDCTITAEGYLRTHGLFSEYEKQVSLRNYKAWLLDVKEQAIDFISNLKDETKIVNHDGTFDTIHNDNTIVKKFIEKEISEIDIKLKEVEDINMSISAEDVLGINLIDIAKNIILSKESIVNN